MISSSGVEGFRKVTERASTRRRNLIRPCSGVRRPRWQTTKSSNCTIQWPNKKRYSSPKSLARFPCTFAVSPPMISVTSVTLAPCCLWHFIEVRPFLPVYLYKRISTRYICNFEFWRLIDWFIFWLFDLGQLTEDFCFFFLNVQSLKQL